MFVTASFCRFLFRLILNRKLWGIFEFSQHSLRKRPIFLLYVFSIFLLFWCFRTKQKQKRKKHHFCRFCRKTSVFVANKVLIFSDLRLYRANYTLPPTFGTRRVGQLSSENFFIFLFFIFCKILWFCQFRFSTEFWAFLIISYLLFFLHKVS